MTKNERIRALEAEVVTLRERIACLERHPVVYPPQPPLLIPTTPIAPTTPYWPPPITWCDGTSGASNA